MYSFFLHLELNLEIFFYFTVQLYGLGAENVVEYEMVDSNGDILTINKDRVVKRTPEGYDVS